MRLAAAEAETLTRIDVDAGTVYLNGVVDDSAMKSRAEQIARSEEAVERVVNNLQIARTP